MNDFSSFSNGTATSTPISDALGRRVHLFTPPTAELSTLSTGNWQEAVEDRLHEIYELEENWDGRHADPIRDDVIDYACRVLEQIMYSKTPPPEIRPMSHSGLMLEWHQHGVELEVEIESPGSLWMSFEDHNTNIEDERLLGIDLRPLSDHIRTVTNRLVAQA